ncbi:MAG: DUF4328 domain-containing protein [Candidatus Limnocylindrales bacterium]
MTDIWVCGACKSVNPRRASRCYKCHAPRPPAGEELLAVDTPVLQRTAVETAAGARGRKHTAIFAIVTIVLIAASMSFRWVSVIRSLDMLNGILAGSVPTNDEIVRIASQALGYYAAGLLGTLAWGIWMGRVIANIPILGGGYPVVTPRTAILESVIPLFNLFRVPAVLRDITTRLSRTGAADNALIAPWWLFLAGSIFIERPIGSILLLFAPDIETAYRWVVVLSLAAAVMTIFGGILAIAIVVRIERLQLSRARDLLDAADAATARQAAGPG